MTSLRKLVASESSLAAFGTMPRQPYFWRNPSHSVKEPVTHEMQASQGAWMLAGAWAHKVLPC